MKYLLIIQLLFLISCSGNRENESLNSIFQERTLLKGKDITYDEMFLGMPGTIFYLDSSLVILDNGADKFFHLIDLHQDQYVGNFGIKGQGPNEFLQPFSFQNITDKEVGVFDLWQKALFGINIEALKNGDTNFPKRFSCGSLVSFTVAPTIDSTYLSMGTYEDCLFKLLDKNGRLLNNYFEYPYRDSAEKEISNRVRAMAYQGVLRSNPDNDKFIFAISASPIINFYKVKDKSISEVKCWNFGYPTYKPEEEKEQVSATMDSADKMGFIDAYVTDQFVYVAYSGKSFKDVRMKCFEATDIFVFDWKGNPVKSYQLDTPITHFCVSSNDNAIYAISKQPEPSLVRFKL